MLIRRILIFGFGSIGKRHLRLARALLPEADIRIFRHQQYDDDVPEYSNGCFFSLNDALSFQPQISLIANPSPMHLDIALPLASDCVHLLIEKPLAASSVGVQELLDTCAENNAVLIVGYNLRFLPSLQKFRELLHQNVIGKILSVRCEVGQNLLSWRPDSDYRQTVSAQANLGGGVLLELSHEIDYLRWIFGEITWVKASCCRQSNLEIDVEDTVHVILGFETGNLTGSLNMDFIRHDPVRQCTAIGERGSLRWNGIEGVVEFFEPGANQWNKLFRQKHQRDDTYLAEWKHFLDCIEGKKKPLVPGEDGLAVLKIIDAARWSAKTGCQVQVL